MVIPKLDVAFSVAVGGPGSPGVFPDDSWESAIVGHMADLEDDLGCFNLEFVPHADLMTTSHTNGVMFTFHRGFGCFSALGKTPGFAGKGVTSLFLEH